VVVVIEKREANVADLRQRNDEQHATVVAVLKNRFILVCLSVCVCLSLYVYFQLLLLLLLL
jgi:hypothetical protein